ncbi:mechanosensitive ion channel protein, partial [Burkholderia cenocepacia]|nr:mechanosensitive ion channel protein [Burkholderia cenocepacia]
MRADQRADFTRTLGILLAVLLPALVVEWLAKRVLRRALAAVAARRADTARRTASDSAASDEDHAPPPDTSAPPDHADTVDAPSSTQSRGHARRHTTLLHRLPRALISLALRVVPLLVF